MKSELLRMIRIVGPRNLFDLIRAYRVGWRDTIGGFFVTRIIQTLINVGFFDEMEARGSIEVDAFAEAHDLDAHILQSLCDALYSQRILQKKGNGYILDKKGEVLLGKARGWFTGVYGYEDVYHSLEELLRKEVVYDEDIFRKPKHVARGFGEMERLVYFPMAVELIQEAGYKKVLDLGCGEGTFLRYVCTHTDADGYGIDISPEAIAEAKEKAQEANLSDRLHFRVQDINQLDVTPDELKDIDMATCFFVLHEIRHIGPDAVVKLLQSFRTHFPQAVLIVFEIIRPTPEELRKRPGFASLYMLQHDITNQAPISLEEWHTLFKTAGFNSVEERYSKFARTAIFTLR